MKDKSDLFLIMSLEFHFSQILNWWMLLEHGLIVRQVCRCGFCILNFCHFLLLNFRLSESLIHQRNNPPRPCVWFKAQESASWHALIRQNHALPVIFLAFWQPSWWNLLNISHSTSSKICPFIWECQTFVYRSCSGSAPVNKVYQVTRVW